MSASSERPPDHRSHVRPKNVYKTTYKWCLGDYSTLYHEYMYQGVTSPIFKVNGADGCTCSMKFTAALDVQSNSMEIQFSGEFAFFIIRATVSIVDKKMKKLIAAEETIEELPNGNRITVRFDKKNDKQSEAETTRYLQDDTLILFAEFVIVKDLEVALDIDDVDLKFCTDVCANIAEMYDKNELLDVTFNVNGTKLYANEAILASASNVFRAMFRSRMSAGQARVVPITDIDAEVFRAFLKYLHTGKVDDIHSVGRALMAVADKYEVLDLLKLCQMSIE